MTTEQKKAVRCPFGGGITAAFMIFFNRLPSLMGHLFYCFTVNPKPTVMVIVLIFKYSAGVGHLRVVPTHRRSRGWAAGAHEHGSAEGMRRAA
jgi:hypothetical protein